MKTQVTPELVPIRTAAMAIYTPPFKYLHGYIYDSKSNMVADQGGCGDENTVKGAVAAQVRGWGRIGYMPNAAALQDEIGQMMAEALNSFYRAAALVAEQEQLDTWITNAVEQANQM